MNTLQHLNFPTTENPVFDPSNGCYHHPDGMTSLFRREGNGWQILEWAKWLAPDYTSQLCAFLADYASELIVEFC